ncbi:flagellar biosynthesis protein FlaG [Terrilactibacillus sp. BCM23-1]|uniref:Flagellar biosynthesis protein FlaG n=1 Tax=Terrilactibacillus tamarindi TaxID=2599694 RepID=A0A6N8CNL5_9BACI|nr:flagellar protein FlaG [Terrilactibacillus tamarindi]MTT31571.1 flagellar biosynthesis protein FlaG [Terrilactibacillus tamarindi]
MDVNLNHLRDTSPTLQQGMDNTIDKVTNEELLNQSKKQDKISFNKKDLTRLVDEANSLLDPQFTEIRYVLHEKLNEYYVKVEDTKTHKVIREIPPKKFLDMYASIAEKLGLIVNKSV